MDAKISIYVLSIFLKVQNFLITLTVISALSVLSTRKNLPLKSTIYENDVENALPWRSANDVMSLAYRRHELIFMTFIGYGLA